LKYGAGFGVLDQVLILINISFGVITGSFKEILTSYFVFITYPSFLAASL